MGGMMGISMVEGVQMPFMTHDINDTTEIYWEAVF